MKSHAVYLGPPPSTSNDHKRSVFERLGRQLDSHVASTSKSSLSFNNHYLTDQSASESHMSQNSIRKRLAEPDDWASGPRKQARRYEGPSDGPSDVHLFTKYPSQDADLARKKKKPPPFGSAPMTAPKYDRHGNLIVSLREKFRAMNKPWDYGEGKNARPRRDSAESYRYGPRPTPMPGPYTSNLVAGPSQSGHGGEESSRYLRWRERRDVITSLDREAANLNYRTNNLKMSLQSKLLPSHESTSTSAKSAALLSIPVTSASTPKHEDGNKRDRSLTRTPRPPPDEMSDGEIIDDSDVEEPPPKAGNSATSLKNSNHQDNSISRSPTQRNSSSEGGSKFDQAEQTLEEISDDECISAEARSNPNKPGNSHLDDGSSSDMSASQKSQTLVSSQIIPSSYVSPGKSLVSHRKSAVHSDALETISDDELEGENRTATAESSNNETKLQSSPAASGDTIADQSEIELLNALGIDWANLVEMAHSQSKSKRTTFIPGCARSRFLASNYLRTIPIPAHLAGPYLSDRIKRLCFGTETKSGLYDEHAFTPILKHEIKDICVMEDSETV